jgi:hypothetical protein
MEAVTSEGAGPAVMGRSARAFQNMANSPAPIARIKNITIPAKSAMSRLKGRLFSLRRNLFIEPRIRLMRYTQWHPAGTAAFRRPLHASAD